MRRLPLFGRLDRYVSVLFLSSYATALLLVVGLFLILDMASNLDRFLEPWEDGTRASALLVTRYYVLQVPYVFLQIGPFVTLLAGMFTVNRMLRHNEVSAVLSGGISAHRMLLPVFIGGAVLAAGMFGVRELVGLRIASQRDALYDTLDEKRSERVYSGLYVDDLSRSHVRLGTFRPDAPGAPITELTAVLRAPDRTMRIEAAGARWVEGTWQLESGVRTVVGDALDVEPVSELSGFDFTPNTALTYRRARDNPLELSFSELQELMRRDPDDVAYQTLWHYQFTFPLANLVLLLVGLPVLFRYERKSGADRMALGGLLCIFYFGFDFVLRSLGLGGGLSPVIASWLPPLLFGSLGVVLYDSLRT
ncbi:MAG: YjgP/YjgQ family permease [bacterium]|nr:YjgP/YjgQ family permease [bacterium]